MLTAVLAHAIINAMQEDLNRDLCMNNRERESALLCTNEALPPPKTIQRNTIPAGGFLLHFYYTRKGKLLQVENLFAQQCRSLLRRLQKGGSYVG